MKYSSAIREVIKKQDKPARMEHFNYTDVPTVTVSRGTPKSVTS